MILAFHSMVRGKNRGHSSLNGVAAAISVTTGKVLDVEVLSRHCKSCTEHVKL